MKEKTLRSTKRGKNNAHGACGQVTELNKKTKSTLRKNKRMRNNDFGLKTSGSRTNVLFSLNRNVVVCVRALLSVHCSVFGYTFFVIRSIIVYMCFSFCFFFCFLYRGDFSPVQLFFVAIGVKLEHGHCVDEAVLCVYVFFSTSNIIVACFSLNLNGFLHLDK